MSNYKQIICPSQVLGWRCHHDIIAASPSGTVFQHAPFSDTCGLLQDSVQLQALAVQQPPEGDISQLTYDPERLVHVKEHGEFPLPVARAHSDGFRHESGGDPLQPCHLRPGNHKLDWGGEKTIHLLTFVTPLAPEDFPSVVVGVRSVPSFPSRKE